MTDELDRTAFVATGGSLPRHWKNRCRFRSRLREKQRDPGPSCERVFVEAQNQSASKTVLKRPSAFPLASFPEAEKSKKARNEASSRKRPSTPLQKTPNRRFDPLLDLLRAAGPFCKQKSIGGRKTLRHSRRAIRLFRKTRCNPSTAPFTARKGGNPSASRTCCRKSPGNWDAASPQRHEAPAHTQMSQAEDVTYDSQRSLLQTFRAAPGTWLAQLKCRP